MKNYIFTPKGLFYGKAKKYKLKKNMKNFKTIYKNEKRQP